MRNKKYIGPILSIIIYLISGYSLANSNKLTYEIYIDAGSSGSRLHLFQYDRKQKFPIIKDIFSVKTNPGISSFVDQPQSAATSLETLLDQTNAVIKRYQLKQEDITVHILATAGMRLLTEQSQQAIYNTIQSSLKEKYAFKIGDIKTISGEEEGLFGWLDLNYIHNNFHAREKTLGSIDLGGASTQIAFLTSTQNPSKNRYLLILNDIKYDIFSKTFLGLGQNQARKSINLNANAKYCYPKGYHLNNRLVGNYNYTNCAKLYDELLKKYRIKNQIPNFSNVTFIGHSNVYNSLHFFEFNNYLGKAALVKKIKSLCQTSWDKLQKMYPNESQQTLANYCANATYVDRLLFGSFGYQLRDRQISAAESYANQEIGIPLGALLYKLSYNRIQYLGND